ncbi:hypothetical protein [Streptomyces sp. NPDC020965]|uniref:hypothetical protein n=1 Tax=Streptomyces sp. NPDC020965 TaxID=3365105 RepID=UPI003787A0A6
MNADTPLIPAFFAEYNTPLPYDEHGRYAPEPGTEFPFSISDIARAAVKILGPDWRAASLSWGTCALVEQVGETPSRYLLAVDEDSDLYVKPVRSDQSTMFLMDVSPSYGVDVLGSNVADVLRTFLN